VTAPPFNRRVRRGAGCVRCPIRTAADAVGLTEHIADLLVERECPLIVNAGSLVLEAAQRDVAEAAETADDLLQVLLGRWMLGGNVLADRPQHPQPAVLVEGEPGLAQVRRPAQARRG
jgi:hypothetical protein